MSEVLKRKIRRKVAQRVTNAGRLVTSHEIATVTRRKRREVVVVVEVMETMMALERNLVRPRILLKLVGQLFPHHRGFRWFATKQVQQRLINTQHYCCECFIFPQPVLVYIVLCCQYVVGEDLRFFNKPPQSIFQQLHSALQFPRWVILPCQLRYP